jgi:hypothetical protein
MQSQSAMLFNRVEGTEKFRPVQGVEEVKTNAVASHQRPYVKLNDSSQPDRGDRKRLTGVEDRSLNVEFVD